MSANDNFWTSQMQNSPFTTTTFPPQENVVYFPNQFNWPTHYNSPHNCPNCGYCSCCGRSNTPEQNK